MKRVQNLPICDERVANEFQGTISAFDTCYSLDDLQLRLRWYFGLPIVVVPYDSLVPDEVTQRAGCSYNGESLYLAW